MNDLTNSIEIVLNAVQYQTTLQCFQLQLTKNGGYETTL